jgi:hypothetical protein
MRTRPGGREDVTDDGGEMPWPVADGGSPACGGQGRAQYIFMGIQLNTHYFCKEKFIHIVSSSYIGGKTWKKHKLAVNPKKKAHPHLLLPGSSLFYLANLSQAHFGPLQHFQFFVKLKHQFACLRN